MEQQQIPWGRDYPKRPQMFFNRFGPHAARCGVAMEVGADGLAFLFMVGMVEDMKRYKGPPRFFNDQLCAYLGCDEKHMIAVRTRLVASGWLHYERPRKRASGIYWVALTDLLGDCSDAVH